MSVCDQRRAACVGDLREHLHAARFPPPACRPRTRSPTRPRTRDARPAGRLATSTTTKTKASRWSPAVSRVLYPRSLPRAGDGHSSRPLVAERLVRPTWNLVSTRATSAGKPRGSDSVLLQVGFAVPLPSPGERCALTTPFHPCLTTRLPAQSGGLLSVALSFESSRLVVNQHPAHGARTFLDGDRRDHPPNSSGKPTRV